MTTQNMAATYDREEAEQSTGWYDAPEVKELINGFVEVAKANGMAARQFTQAVMMHHTVDGSLAQSLCGLTVGVGTDSLEAAAIGAQSLHVLCGFVPPLTRDWLQQLYQNVLMGFCVVCGEFRESHEPEPPAEPATPPGCEMFLCRTCAQESQLVLLSEARKQVPQLPALCFPTMHVPVVAGEVYTLKMFVHAARSRTTGAGEGATSGTKPDAVPKNTFPAALERFLPPPGEDQQDKLFKALGQIQYGHARKMLYEVREMAKPNVAEVMESSVEHILKLKRGRAGTAAGSTKQADEAKRATERLLCMAERWDGLRKRLAAVSPLAIAVAQMADRIPRPSLCNGATVSFKRHIRVEKDSGIISDELDTWLARMAELSVALDDAHAKSVVADERQRVATCTVALQGKRATAAADGTAAPAKKKQKADPGDH